MANERSDLEEGTAVSSGEAQPPGPLLTIGRFARLAGLSEGALRHYDALGVLRPAAIDDTTGYRRYSPAQLPRAQTIARLRALQMPLDEVAVLVAAPDTVTRARAIARHRARLEARSIRAARALHMLDHAHPTQETIVSAPATPPALDPATHRALGAGLFNRTWELLEIEERTPEQDDELIHTAHASAYHWSKAAPAERVRGARAEWLCARVYSTLGRGDAAVRHATRCLEILEDLEPGSPESGGREEWDLPGAYEGLARAYAIAGDAAASEQWASRGREAIRDVVDAEDRGFIEQDLATLPRAGGR